MFRNLMDWKEWVNRNHKEIFGRYFWCKNTVVAPGIRTLGINGVQCTHRAHAQLLCLAAFRLRLYEQNADGSLWLVYLSIRRPKLLSMHETWWIIITIYHHCEPPNLVQIHILVEVQSRQSGSFGTALNKITWTWRRVWLLQTPLWWYLKTSITSMIQHATEPCCSKGEKPHKHKTS